MRLLHCLPASALLVALVAPAAWARGDDMFKMMDSNNDGRISTQEHDAGAAAMFARMDANHDGMLDAGEMGPRMRHEGGMHGGGMHGGDWMAKMDANHDGAITSAEHAAAAQAMFAEMDADHDGRLVGAELEAGHRMPGHAMDDHGMQPDSDNDDPAMGMGRGDMEGHGMHGMHGQGGMAEGHMQMRASMDADHDGKVSATEHAAAARSMFAKVDADHDGYVTKAEFAARMGAMQQP